MQRNRNLLLAALVAMGPAWAADFNYDFVACSSSKPVQLEANGDMLAYGVESWGVVASSTTKFWENASTHCVGYMRIMAGSPVGKGVCKWTEAGGDTAVGEWEVPAGGEPVWTWLTGTGKLKGITGSGTFRFVFTAKPTDPTTSQGCRRDWGKFSLPG